MSNKKPPVLRPKIRTLRGVCILVGILATTVLIGGFAFNNAFPRQAEAAVGLLPADTTLALIVDIQPSVGQFMAFRRIMNAADKHDLVKEMDRGLERLFAQTPAGEKVSEQVNRSVLIAYLGNNNSEIRMSDGNGFVAMIGLKEPTIVEETLIGHDSEEIFSVEIHRQLFAGRKPLLKVIGDMLIVALDETSLQKIEAVAKGSESSLLSNKDYQQARASLDSDSNISVFISSNLYSDSLRNADFKIPSPDWFAAGMAIRDDGLAFSSQIPMSEEKFAPYRHLSSAQPLPSDLLQRLPSGAYGFVAIAQPDAYWKATMDILRMNEGEARLISDIAERLDRATGLNIGDDVKSAGRGNFIVAAYPTDRDSESPSGISGLVVFDDENGASPGRLVDRVAEHVKNNNLSADLGSKDDFFNVKQKFGESINVLSPTWQNEIDRVVDRMPTNDQKMYSGLTVTYATPNDALMVADRESLLADAIGTYKTRNGGLNSSSVFGAARATVLDRAHIVAIIDIAQCARSVKAYIDSINDEHFMDAKGRQVADDVLEVLTEIKAPAYFAQSFRKNAIVSKAFLPIDYEKAIDVLANELPDIDKMFRVAQEASAFNDDMSFAKQVAIGFMIYLSDNNERFPLSMNQYDVETYLQPYVKNISLFRTRSGEAWIYNEHLAGQFVFNMENPANTVLLYSAPSPYTSERIVAFVDGHVKKVSAENWKANYESQLQGTVGDLVSPEDYMNSSNETFATE